jgi:hypothetical protein
LLFNSLSSSMTSKILESYTDSHIDFYFCNNLSDNFNNELFYKFFY